MKAMLIAAAILASGLASANDLADDLTNTLYGMKAVFRAQYAPVEWKKKFTAYDLDEIFAASLSAVQTQPDLSLPTARNILKNVIYSARDYHTSIQFALTEAASLPLTIRGAGDRYFIVYIDREKLSQASFPFGVGDEVVTFGGIPTPQAVAEVQSQYVQNVPETDKARAELFLTKRSAARGIAVPKGPITLGIKRKNSSTIVQRELIWDYTPENVFDRSPLVFAEADVKRKPVASQFHPMMDVDVTSAVNPQDIGARKTFTPDLGVKVWESAANDPFYAYIYKTEDRRLIGYVRIASYVMPDYSKALGNFSDIIKRFESTTDAMIIDQVNNPGGSVFYLYSLASMLTEQPLRTPLHRMTITQSSVMGALEIKNRLKDVKNDDDAKKVIAGDDSDGFPITYEFAQFMLASADFTLSEWAAGRRLTMPFWIGGANQINPAPVHYTKPILLLVNHLDFSGGDFFPAILQDNHRVKIFGSRTAGAGGYVLEQTPTNNLGIAAYRVTGSIAERVNGNPIENLGVTPDISYEMTAEDYQSNYAPYVKAIKDAINSIL